jgi:hypothetical protein
MATRKGKGRTVKADVEALRGRAGPRSGTIRTVLYLRAEQLAALHGLAQERAEERGALRPDVSEAARVALDDWLRRRK